MSAGRVRFDRFTLDPSDRRLERDGVPVDLNARYLDALALMVAEAGRLVRKDRFLDEVWRGVPVTDEALTQCVKMLRRQLGDDAARPRFIETVPKHGYRFIAPVEPLQPASPPHATGIAPQRIDAGLRTWVRLGLAGMSGGVVAGLIGGLIYGFLNAAQPQSGVGAISILLVLMCVTLLVALLGGAGVAFGIAAGRQLPRPMARVAGGALGGLVVGGVVKLLGLDAFALFVGASPGNITGAGEGAVLGGAVGLAWLAAERIGASPRRSAALAAIIGALAGIAIDQAGGRLMAGSLDLLARHLPTSRLRLDPIGALVGEPGFGPVSQIVTATLEAALFSALVVGAMRLVDRPSAGQ